MTDEELKALVAGILAAVTIPENLRVRALKEGLYLATISLRPQRFSLTGEHLSLAGTRE